MRIHHLGGHYGVMERNASEDTMESVDSVASGPNQVPNPDHVHPSFLLRVRILDEPHFTPRCKFLDLRKLDEIIDLVSFVFEVKASVLVGVWLLNDGLAKILDLLLRRDLAHMSLLLVLYMNEADEP